MRNLAIFVVFVSVPFPAYACSFGPGYELYEPRFQDFEEKFDRNGYLATLPAPEKVEVQTLIRGTAAPGASCEDAGILTIRITWPQNSIYGLDEVGFYFRADAQKLPDLIFPLEPIVPIHFSDNEATFTFIWLDGHPSRQRPLDFELEVFAVNMGLQIGPPRTIRVSK